MLFAISVCFLVGVVNVVSSQPSAPDHTPTLTEQVPILESRTLGHIKPIHRRPIIKKHKNFVPWLPNVKTEFTVVPIVEAPHPPLYKIHRFHGIDLKPVEDSALSHPPFEFYPESHSYSSLSPPQFTFLNSPPKHAFYSLSSSLPTKTTISSDSPPVIAPPLPSSPPVTFFKHPEPLLPSIPLPPTHSLPVASLPLIQPIILPHTGSPSAPPLFQSTVAVPPISTTPAPILHSFQSSNFAFPTPIPTADVTHPPAIDFSSPIIPEPQFPYPPSNTPIPSNIKDISLTEQHAEVPQSAPEVSFAEKDTTKHAAPAVLTSKPHEGLLKKFKGWKTQTANAALNHLNKFNKFQNYIAPAHSTVSDKTSSQLPVLPSLPFHAPSPSDSKPFQGHFSLPYQNPPSLIKYEQFPPNHEFPPPLFNSYGVPIPHDSYAPPRQASHDRVSPAASEEKVSVLPPPPNFTEEIPKPFSVKNEQLQGTPEQQTSQSPLEFETKNYRQFQPSSEVIFKERPVYVPDNKEVHEEGDKQTEVSQFPHDADLESNAGKIEQDLGSLSNHREE